MMRLQLSFVALGLLVPGAALVACEDSSGNGGAGAVFDAGGSGFEGGATNEGGTTGGDGGADAGAGGDAGATFTTFHVAMGQSAACAVFPDGRMKCWGRPNIGETMPIGDAPGQMGAALPYVALAKRVKKVAAAQEYGEMCVVFEDGALRCWGGANLGQNTNGAFTLDKITTDVDLGAGRTAVDVSVGYGHVCAILDDGSVKCWGGGSEGALGQGNALDLATPPATPVALGTGRTAKALATGLQNTCALLDDGRLKCWGRNSNTADDSGTGVGGALGIGGTHHIGNDPNEMGDNLQYVRLGTNPMTGAPWKVKKVAAANVDYCAILENDRVKCWGRNDGGGALGSGGSQAYGDTVLDDDIAFVDVGTNPMTAAPFAVADIGVGAFSTCALTSTGIVRCWGGGNAVGALGRGDNATIGDGPNEMGDLLINVALKPGRTPSALYAGFFSTCARVDAATLNCWGSNAQGVLGQGVPSTEPTDAIGDDAAELGAALAETLLQ